MAKAKDIWTILPGKIELEVVTIKLVKHNKRSSHLFTKTLNGAVSDGKVSFCGIPVEPTAMRNWKEDNTKPLCNHCGRKFHFERKIWLGLP